MRLVFCLLALSVAADRAVAKDVQAQSLRHVIVSNIGVLGSEFAQRRQSMRALAKDERVYARRYAAIMGGRAIRFGQQIEIGTQLPAEIKLYEIEGKQSLTEFRYAILDSRVVVVEPTERRIIDVID